LKGVFTVKSLDKVFYRNKTKRTPNTMLDRFFWLNPNLSGEKAWGDSSNVTYENIYKIATFVNDFHGQAWGTSLHRSVFKIAGYRCLCQIETPYLLTWKESLNIHKPEDVEMRIRFIFNDDHYASLLDFGRSYLIAHIGELPQETEALRKFLDERIAECARQFCKELLWILGNITEEKTGYRSPEELDEIKCSEELITEEYVRLFGQRVKDDGRVTDDA